MNAQEYLKRGIEYYEKQDDNRAYADFTEAYRLDPNLAGVKKYLACFYYNFGAVSHQKGDKVEAIKQFRKAAEFDRDDVQYFETLAKMLTLQNNNSELIEAWESFEPSQPTLFVLSAVAYAYHYIAKEYRNDEKEFRANQEKSIEFLTRCSKDDPNYEQERIAERLAAAEKELKLRFGE